MVFPLSLLTSVNKKSHKKWLYTAKPKSRKGTVRVQSLFLYHT